MSRIEVAGKSVHRLGFGAMRLAGSDIWDPPADRAHSVRVARRAVERGVEFIDTADSYAFGVTEEILAEALHPYPEHLLIGTKVGQVQTRRREWVPVGRPEYLRQQCEASLRRLRVERIDLLSLHRVDPAVPLEDQVGELKALRDEGKIGAVGLSEVGVEQIEQARAVVDIASVQNIYNLSVRGWDAVVDHCTRERIAFVPWYPILSGGLAGAGGVVADIAREHDATVAQIALAWLLARSDVMVPIPGTGSLGHLEENMAATRIALSPDQYAALLAAPVPTD
ncbi:aldo/keto reductase [Symbioplanes lichenis]|uniref:aldo/keto reductase n=1 Tax=Symbioplanes lichenis TaxID=1629072 RepID=UPI002739E4EE|nr:aldo/keto reductase [Actinoplanes lichenis]